jgi:EAL and modified HD-GYP domain-containing signal transduction protein
MIRARMCELLAGRAGRHDGETCFTVGLLSVLDAFLDAPLEQVLVELPLDEDVAQALLRKSGPYGELLVTVLAYEQGRFEQLPQRSEENALGDCYLEAVAWAEEANQQLAALAP